MAQNTHVYPAVVVLDINGVLADVRKKHSARPIRRPPDLMLPSGQPVYFRPGIETLATYLCDRFRGRTVLWTSRKANNAFPIEKELYYKYGFQFSAYLHGEDCARIVQYHPLKDPKTLFKLMNLSPQRDVVLFVDDHADRIEGITSAGDRHSSAFLPAVLVPVETYDAKIEEEENEINGGIGGDNAATTPKTAWLGKLLRILDGYTEACHY